MHQMSMVKKNVDTTQLSGFRSWESRENAMGPNGQGFYLELPDGDGQ